MVNVKCADCAEYKNEWCEKVIDSPHPDMLRDCQYFHEKDMDLIRVTRCKDCKHFHEEPGDPFWDRCDSSAWYDGDGCEQQVRPTDYCSFAERKDGEE